LLRRKALKSKSKKEDSRGGRKNFVSDSNSAYERSPEMKPATTPSEVMWHAPE